MKADEVKRRWQALFDAIDDALLVVNIFYIAQ
jgi:hypothetical protein